MMPCAMDMEFPRAQKGCRRWPAWLVLAGARYDEMSERKFSRRMVAVAV